MLAHDQPLHVDAGRMDFVGGKFAGLHEVLAHAEALNLPLPSKVEDPRFDRALIRAKLAKLG